MLRLKRAILALTAGLCVLGSDGFAFAEAGSAWQPTDDDSLLFEVQLGQYRLGNGVRGYQTPEGVCVNLPDMVSALDIAVDVDQAKGIAQGWAFEERNQLKIDRNTGKVRIADRQQPLDPGTIRDTPDGWCVLATSLSAWLGIDLSPDLSNALIAVSSKQKLPVQLAAERRARAAQVRPSNDADLGKLPPKKLPYRMWRTPSLDAVVTFGGLSDKQQGKRIDRRYDLYASGEIAKMSVDARLSSNDDGEPEAVRVRAYRSDADGRLLGPIHATHFEIGDVSSSSSPLVAQSAPGRGVMLTNRPLDRPETFDRKTFRGELPTGWEAELYRNGQLLAVSQGRADGRYEFPDVPLVFGPNRVEIVLYGPQGQVRRTRETIAVGPESIPPKQTWYWASLNEATHDIFSLGGEKLDERRGWRGSMGVERGLDAKTSISAQVHSLMLDDERLTYVEGAVRRSVGSALIEIGGAREAHGGTAGHAQVVAQFGDTYVTAESIFAHKFRSDRVLGNVKGEHRIGVEHSFDLGKLVLPVHVEGHYTQRAGGSDSINGEARISAALNRFSMTGELDWQLQHGASGPDPPGLVEAALLANGTIGKTRLRGELRWRLSPQSRFQTADLVAERTIGERASLRGELGYDRGLDRVRGGLGYVRQFNRFALSVTGEAATDGSVAAGLNLALSLGPNPRGGMRVTSQKLASGGSVLARVFRDDNGDGIREPGEELAKDVQVMVARVPTEKVTDTHGEVMIDGLEPHRPIQISVDASSLPDPLIQPSGPGVAVTTRPGLPVVVDLPLVSAGEIMGTLAGSSGGTLEGIDIELVSDAGLVIATARSDYDGYFLFEGVPYGHYSLRLNKLSAQAANLPIDLQLPISVGGAKPSVRLGTVTAGSASALRIAAATLSVPDAPHRLSYQDVLMAGPGTAAVVGQ